MKREDIFFDSKDGSSKIHAVRWEPECEPKAILQIVHGMAEYVDRYEDFASFLAEKGFVVTADDHLGHGKSLNNNPCGYFCDRDPASVVVDDVYSLTTITKDKYPGVPYFILGHSMGSFIARNYLFTYGDKVDRAIVMGTGMQPKVLVVALKAMAGLGCLFGKSKKPDKFIDGMSFGAYNKKIANPRTSVDWLTKDSEIVDKYVADPLCGFVFTANGFKTLASLLWRLNKKSNVAKMPKDLPILITSGADDPVGEYGKGPTLVYESYKALGIKDVSLKLYDNDRHEILNETDRNVVYNDIYEWLSNGIGQ